MRRILPVTIAALMLVAIGLGAPAAASGGEQDQPVCPTTTSGSASCGSVVMSTAAGVPLGSATPSRGYSAAQLRQAYGGGNGRATIAIVSAYAHPHPEADLAAYRAAMGMAPLAPGQFTQVAADGETLPPSDMRWGFEEMNDLEMATALCPSCRLVYVAAASPSWADLSDAVRTAAEFADVISNSYGSPEFPGEQRYTAWDDAARAGIAVTVAAGDFGYGTWFPAASRNVTAVGGTTLQLDAAGNRIAESAWAATGSGCSQFIRKPSWQHDAGCPRRTVADIAAVADPATGVAVYDSFVNNPAAPWFEFGGTSVSAPIVAGVYGAQWQSHGQDGRPVVARLYSDAAHLFDVTSGSNGTCDPAYLCTAGVGYDGPSGNGAPMPARVDGGRQH